MIYLYIYIYIYVCIYGKCKLNKGTTLTRVEANTLSDLNQTQIIEPLWALLFDYVEDTTTNIQQTLHST